MDTDRAGIQFQRCVCQLEREELLPVTASLIMTETKEVNLPERRQLRYERKAFENLTDLGRTISNAGRNIY